MSDTRMPFSAITCAPRWLRPTPLPKRLKEMSKDFWVSTTHTVSLSSGLMLRSYQSSNPP